MGIQVHQNYISFQFIIILDCPQLNQNLKKRVQGNDFMFLPARI